MDNKYFTIYWLNGDYSVIQGESIEQAFTAAGYGAGAVKAVDWYDNGISQTHYYNKKCKEWVHYVPLEITSEQIQTFDLVTLQTKFQQHKDIKVIFPSKDILILTRDTGIFATIGIVSYISLAFGEYCQGSYSNPDDEGHHFMIHQSEYFYPTDEVTALEALLTRVKSLKPCVSSGNGQQLDVIGASQQK